MQIQNNGANISKACAESHTHTVWKGPVALRILWSNPEPKLVIVGRPGGAAPGHHFVPHPGLELIKG